MTRTRKTLRIKIQREMFHDQNVKKQSAKRKKVMSQEVNMNISRDKTKAKTIDELKQ